MQAIKSSPPEILPAFDNELYFEAQCEAFYERIDGTDQTDIVIEFGGKPFGDHHASRVLPGYCPDIKARVLNELQSKRDTRNIMVVNAKDILPEQFGRTPHGRIRGDSSLRYDDETSRIIIESRETHGIEIDGVALSVTPRLVSLDALNQIRDFKQMIKQTTGLSTSIFSELSGYPDASKISIPTLEKDERLHHSDRPTVLMSPGGGSGKFGVAFSELFGALSKGNNSSFAKFETFPVFNLPPDHPLNLAFEAATADLGNVVFAYEDGKTNYDKDDQNYKLIQWLADRFQANSKHLQVSSPFDFSVNVIESGIRNHDFVAQACLDEIDRRITRYMNELSHGDEKPATLERTRLLQQQCIGYLAVAKSGTSIA